MLNLFFVGISLLCTMPIVILVLLIMRSKSTRPVSRVRFPREIQIYDGYPYIEIPPDDDWSGKNGFHRF